MRYLYVSLLALALCLSACNGGGNNSPDDPTEGSTFATVLVDGIGDCPGYYVLTNEDQTIYVYADELPQEPVDGFVFLTLDEIEQFGMLEVPACDDPSNFEDANHGHGNDPDHFDEDNPSLN